MGVRNDRVLWTKQGVTNVTRKGDCGASRRATADDYFEEGQLKSHPRIIKKLRKNYYEMVRRSKGFDG